MNSQENKGAMILNADQLAITVLNFRKLVSPNNEQVGTGSFISKDGKLYIVTASHVAKIMDSSSQIIIQGENNKPIKLDLTQLANPIKWIHHNEADLSVLELNPSQEIIMKYLQKRFVPYELIDTDKKAISRNTQLTIIGFPLGLGASEFFSPLTYRTFASSGLISLNRFDLNTPQTFIILENPSIGGYSGGPVYDLSIIESGNMQMTGSGTKLHGFIHGTLSDNTGGKLAAVTPSYYLSDLIK
ncbi:serine protease [Flavobacterium plurextorum]|uniref:S1 family peptidase n=1 Tax=Flavobacterium TaxID=237 RepID=UPI00214D3183|nr:MULTISPECIES: serine protease [Flavobacterium]UUW10205.1 serine protease [Flavobacterium plurextorum]